MYVIILGWSGAENKCTVYVALPKRPINQFKLYQQSRQQAIRGYCSNIYTLLQCLLVGATVHLVPRQKYIKSDMKKKLESISFDESCLKTFSGKNSAFAWGFDDNLLGKLGSSEWVKLFQPYNLKDKLSRILSYASN